MSVSVCICSSIVYVVYVVYKGGWVGLFFLCVISFFSHFSVSTSTSTSTSIHLFFFLPVSLFSFSFLHCLVSAPCSFLVFCTFLSLPLSFPSFFLLILSFRGWFFLICLCHSLFFLCCDLRFVRPYPVDFEGVRERVGFWVRGDFGGRRGEKAGKEMRTTNN